MGYGNIGFNNLGSAKQGKPFPEVENTDCKYTFKYNPNPINLKNAAKLGVIGSGSLDTPCLYDEIHHTLHKHMAFVIINPLF